MSELKITSIDKFLGVNKSTTETQIELGEASDMSNWLITDDYKLQKMFGYEEIFDSLGEHEINGGWYGQLSDTYYFVFSCNGKVYSHNLTTGVNTDIGNIKDSHTMFFVDNNTLYIFDGDDIYKWTGTGNISTVVGYVPTVTTATPPTGGGMLLEDINYITGQKIQKFSGDGITAVFQLLELDVNSVDEVKVGGVVLTVDTEYTVDLKSGTVSFMSEPPNVANNVIITFTKETTGDRGLIAKNTYYGGVYYSRTWIFGNPDQKNTRYPSGVTLDGVADPTYWPKYADSTVGEYEITDIKTQYNKQIIFSSGAAWYSEEDTYTDPDSGILVTLFPVYPMNPKVGNVAKGQVQIILNNPFTVWKGVYQWVSTYVVNEKNAEWISKRVQPDLDKVDLSTALTFDWDDKGLYWLCVGSTIWVYNYRADVWYIHKLKDTPTCFINVDSALYFGTDKGQIMKFDENLLSFNGEIIDAVWEMGFYDFGVEWIQKFVQRLFISLKPENRSLVNITYKVDSGEESDTYSAIYKILDWDNVDFDDYTFNMSRDPQPFKFKIRAKKFDYLKLKLRSNTEGYTATVLSVTLPSRTGGEVKRRN